MIIIGGQLHINHIKQGGKNHMGISLDIKNVKSTFDRAKAKLTAHRVAQTNPSLEPLAIGFDELTIVILGIFMRSNKRAEGFQRICSSESTKHPDLKLWVGSSDRKYSKRIRRLGEKSLILGSTFVERRLELKNM
jgi:hypothetical protein